MDGEATENAIWGDPRLTEEPLRALLSVYRRVVETKSEES